MSILACATCMGSPDSPMTQAALGGVIVMFGVVAFVLAAIGGIAIYWTKRARMLEASEAFDARPRMAGLGVRPRQAL